MPFYEFKKDQFVLAFCYKAGSASIKNALLDQPNVAWTQAHRVADSGFPVVMFVRDPIERLNSCWAFFGEKIKGWPLYETDPSKGNMYFSCYEAFVDAVLEGLINRHWTSQAKTAAHAGKMLVTEPLEFSRINELWDTRIGCGKLEKLNASDAYQINRYREDDVRAFYADDCRLMERAQ